MTISEFFDRLDELLGAGKIAEIRAFIAPFRDQFEALELRAKAKTPGAQRKKAETEREQFEASLEKSKAEKRSLREEISRLQGEIEALQYDKAQLLKTEGQKWRGEEDEKPPDELDDIPIKILLALREMKAGHHEPQAGHIAHAINANQALVAHWLVKLDGKGLVRRVRLSFYAKSHKPSADDDCAWAITTEGTDYLIERKLWGQPDATGVETSEANTEQQKIELRVLEILLKYKWQNTREIQERMGFPTIEKAELVLARLERGHLIRQNHSPYIHEGFPRQGDWSLSDKGKEKLESAGLL